MINLIITIVLVRHFLGSICAVKAATDDQFKSILNNSLTIETTLDCN
jgi:hypothetical protein